MLNNNNGKPIGHMNALHTVNTYRGGVAVVPSDTVDLTNVSSGLFIGGAGNVKVDTGDGSTLTFSGLTAGSILPVAVKRVYATGTTATLMVAIV